ncbi:hypothetical protein V500_01725 [Pseudogymnoascus sp. VKM F-4518 (FW-2643)]|nr:hypothetical protein V500_01725 [Pseudogymnoascus sp. VKM F-4518 (FW-2643)]
MAPYFATVTSESTFRARFAAEERKTFSELREVSASEWGREHLFACRVVPRETQHNILPVLLPYAFPGDAHTSPEIIDFLDGPTGEHMGQSEHLLVRNCGISLGNIWAAMALLKGHRNRRRTDIKGDSGDESDSEVEESRPKRIRRNTTPENFVNSSMIQIGSSSPTGEGSQVASSVGYVDVASHTLLMPPEDGTLRLASCAIRHILYFAPPQDSSRLATVVEFRDAKTRLTACTPVLERRLVATDDGGLCLRQRSNDSFTVVKNRVALLEAKRRFQCIENGKPVISDNCLAQMTCEALVARLTDPLKEFRHGRYSTVLPATSTVMFLADNII